MLRKLPSPEPIRIRAKCKHNVDFKDTDTRGADEKEATLVLAIVKVGYRKIPPTESKLLF